MINKKYLFVIFFSFFLTNLFSEEAPKKIIILEENLDIEKVDVEQTKKNSQIENEDDLEKVFTDTEINENKNLVVIDDIPKEFND